MFEVGEFSCGDEGGDFIAKGISDSGEFAEAVGADEFGKIGGGCFEGAGRVEVGATFEGVFSLELENGTDFAEGSDDLILGHGWKLSTESWARQRKELVAIDLPEEAGDAFGSTK